MELIAITKLMPLKILMQVQSMQPPKCDSVAKNTSYHVQIIKIGPLDFLHSSPLYELPEM